MVTYKGYELNAPLKKIYFKKKNKKLIAKQYICLDTETSHNHNPDLPVCWIYQWSFTFNGALYYGRRPSELIDKLKEIIKTYGLNEDKSIYVYVHNLPYDFSYLVLFFRDAFGDPVKLLAHDAHKPFYIKYTCGIELKCSFKLSNDSLARWGNKLGIKHPKLVDVIDYEAIINQNDPLGKMAWHYQWTDCIALDECIMAQMELYGDDISSIPYTSTGYPRRELFRAFNGAGKHNKKNKERQKFRDTALDIGSYLACYEEFSGGITHGNRYYKGITQKADDKRSIRHRDFRSMYPSEQHGLFPMEKFMPLTGLVKIHELYKYAKQYAILCHVVLEDARIKSKKITMPYLQTSHLLRHHTPGTRFLDDNGRIVQFKGQCDFWLDFNELLLVLNQYDYSYIAVTETYASKLDYLPRWMLDTIDARFKGKSDLKLAIEDAKASGAGRDELLKLNLDLMKTKNMLNGIYGVSGTNPVRDDYILTGNKWENKKPTKDEIGDKLKKFYSGYKNFMRYQWGIYTTVWSRLRLMKIYEIIGPENFIYADTDSMFYYSTPEIEKKLDAYNDKLKDYAMSIGAYVTTDDGKIINYFSFDDEGEDIKEFRFLHSKCYAYVTEDKKGKRQLHCTIAGVKAYDKASKTYREDELGDIDNLTDGFIFTKCGGTAALYLPNKANPIEDVFIYENNETCGGCIITKVTKTMSSEAWSETEKMYIVRNN